VRHLILLVAALGGCTQDEKPTCEYGYPNDPWRAPTTVMQTHFDLETLSCTQSSFEAYCTGSTETGPDGTPCYCGTTRIRNEVTMPVTCPVDSCNGLDEVACPQGAGCFVVRDASTNAYVGCWQAGVPSLGAACSTHTTASDCKDGVRCAGLYSSTGPGTWVFAACTDL
jgi:hypothetical protein